MKPDAAQVLPTVAVVVVTYNNSQDTYACLARLNALTYPDVKVIVVDNGSSPREDGDLEASFGESIEVLRVETNRGYGPGANIGIDRALAIGASFVWLVNNDALVDEGSLSALVDVAVRNGSVGIFSPLITAPQGPESPHGLWYAGGSLALGRAQSAHSQRLPEGTAPFATGYITGCAMLVRSSVFRDVGLLREDLFLFWEDVDLNLRAASKGWGLTVVPSAKVFHKVHGSIPQLAIRRYSGRNALWIVATHADFQTFVRATFHEGRRVARAWISAILRRRAAPWPETIGLVEGVSGALSARSRTARLPASA